MHQFERPLRVLSVLFLLAAAAVGQTLSVSPGPTLKAGETASIKYVDTSNAGGTVTLTITNAAPEPFNESIDIEVTLDANGKATATWIVDDSWDYVEFSAPGANEVSCPIIQSSRVLAAA